MEIYKNPNCKKVRGSHVLEEQQDRGLRMKRKNKSYYQNRYPNIKFGFGSHFPAKPRFRATFHPFFWRDVRLELRCAWQRVIHGYDDSATWDLDEHLKKYIVKCLLHLADNHHGVPQLEEWVGKPVEEQSELWAERLSEIAAHFYESCKWEDSEIEKNEFEEEWFNSHEYGFEPVGNGRSRMVTTPINGYTQEQVDDFKVKFRKSEREIEEYKKAQFALGVDKLMPIFEHLGD